MSFAEKSAATFTGWPSNLFMPADLQAYLESDVFKTHLASLRLKEPDVKIYKREQ